MLKQFAQLALVILCVFWGTQVCIAQNTIDDEEYVVYSDLIRQTYGDDTTSHLAIDKTIRSQFIDSDSKYIVKKLSPLDAEMVKDFNEKNNVTAEIQNRFNLKSKINIVGDEINEVLKRPQNDDDIIEDKGWDEFRKKYQTFSLLSLSRVGFNKKRNQAFVLFGSQYGRLAGRGYFYLLVKKRNSWKIKKKVQAWIS